jgi:putative acetyltransferase
LVLICSEKAGDAPPVAALLRAAFGGDREAILVERLRADSLICRSLVACEGETLVGHIVFSRIAVELDGRPIAGAALAPLAVLPGFQRRGIGSALVHAGLAQTAEVGIEAVIVLGGPDFYQRFGFSAALAAKLAAPFSGAAFMALELLPGALHGTKGRVDYPPAFDLAGQE